MDYNFEKCFGLDCFWSGSETLGLEICRSQCRQCRLKCQICLIGFGKIIGSRSPRL